MKTRWRLSPKPVSGKKPLDNSGELAAQTIILVFCAEILVNLHQPLRPFVVVQQAHQILFVAQQIMFHEPEPFIVRRFFFGLEKKAERRFQ